MSAVISWKHAKDAAADMSARELCAERRRLEKMEDRLDIWDKLRLEANKQEMRIRRVHYVPRK